MACFSAEIERTCRASSPRLMDAVRATATSNAAIDLIRRLRAALGTRQVHPHRAQVLVYSRDSHGSRTRSWSPRPDAESNPKGAAEGVTVLPSGEVSFG